MSVSRCQSNAFRSKSRFFLVGVVVTTALAGCATPQTAMHYNKGKEHFAAGKKWGKASQKVIADGQPVPRGGGQYLVGRPYHVAGKTYVPHEDDSYSATGMASWYGAAFHGRRTSNGEIYDMASITAAHPTMPLPSYARVTNLSNGYSVIVRVNDRGPFHGGRVMDVSSRTADILNFKGAGTARIKVDYVGRAPMEGSDDNMLLASLRTDGSPANLDGYASPVMVASAAESTLGGLFSRSEPQPAPAPAPEPEAVAEAAPAPAPAPEPVRVSEATVAAAPPARPEAEASAADDDAAPPLTPHRIHGVAPMPPARPFDLGEISATIEVAPSRPEKRVAAVLPPRKPIHEASAERALYFSNPDHAKHAAHGAFDRVKSAD